MNVKQIVTTIAAVGSIALMGACSSGAQAAAPTVTKTVPGPTVTVTAAAAPAPATTITVTAQPPQAQAAITDDGIYQVGVDIKPGTYVAKGPFGDTGCYWARLKSADPQDMIVNDLVDSGQAIVTIKKSDADFQTTGCGEWTKR